MKRILVVEDEIAIAELICLQLNGAGYDCCYKLDGEAAADDLEEHSYDLILLDIMLPKIDGYELMEYIEPMNIPVIFLTAKGSTRDKVKGLKLGADDYIVKPFEPEELLARVEAVLRRYGKGQDILEAKNIKVDTMSRTVMLGGDVIALTPREYELLVYLMQNKNIALYREELFEKVWETEFDGDSRTLDLHIQRLRKKLNLKDEIRTIYKLGYMFTVK